MENTPDYQAGMNYVLCCYIRRDVDGMKQAFALLMDRAVVYDQYEASHVDWKTPRN